MEGGISPLSGVYALVTLPDGDLLMGGDFAFVGGVVSAELARRTTRPTCVGDFNCSSSLDISDITEFIASWFAMEPRANIDGGPGVDIHDLFDFLNAWFAGC
jgi:hypothetical protein